MDKRVILAVAGSGKTESIIDALDLRRRTLVLSYTENNLKNLRARILRRYDSFPQNISLLSYFTFLYGFCFKPFLWMECGARGINWNIPPDWTSRLKRSDPRFYFDSYRHIYYNRISKLLEERDLLSALNKRLEKYFDEVLIDEIQDFAGHDFNLLKSMAQASVGMLLTGDFFQHTYDTSRDGNVNASLHKELGSYARTLKATGLSVDMTTLSKSFRCSASVCAFVSKNLGISIESHRNDETPVREVTEAEEVKRLLECERTVKLFYREHYLYKCYSQNWGASKGEDNYGDVCVVLNKETAKRLAEGSARKLSPQTRNKLYVACTRARGALYLVPQELIQKSRSRS